MKSFLRKFVPALLLLAFLASPVSGQTRIGTINLRKTFDNYWKRKDAEAALKERETEMQKELQGRYSDYEKAKEEYQKLLTSAYDQAVSSDEREKRKKSAEDKLRQLKEMEDELKKMDRSATQHRDERRKRVRDNLLTEINSVLIAKAKSGSYSLIIDTEAETPFGTKIVLYSGNENDLTDEVLKQLNAGAPSDTPKPEEKKEDKKEEKKDEKKKSTKK